ncbi:UTP--glucose-1-phosphate uridylyltransferase GalU [Taylorella equigenitalis]|uniref:UTP--glucose-1-phosphate uridylyltransferase GalU n=1 Tax=Taylorella equigenitalis TaxID=29575 RepID=UPI00237E7296|nr:UTP--glucose-1-phosphate uridylyltransferase GalU [Taylorella equigenitalis]WDU51542.1 UTP--glucose-1-phosphate uridylyltransferase GalU [Taylorella equigenitalis]WEE00097.1 UTP--glucose-1-phosphate uridylyltransferase GalU [Taylorella equigenitalis]WEE01574.1 UTP--glucose-1-phosphate uridylyltransferase GalU [Taylorella equigenitalis]WFD78111.1 UTP--glucose-1-phosphate uridylyltransferase GalU [Taylorella equigenitalis]WFD79589.1 UTP--glucose-1-phosphate uridylyltransferase GalU [Taylorell
MSTSSKKVTKAVFPVFGFGTRFLPITKSLPKEMLPIIDKPLLHYAVKEAVDAGIRDLIFIVGSNRQSIEDYFDRNLPLENKLESDGKLEELGQVRDIVPPNVNCIFIRQHSPIGLGHAVLKAKPVIGEDSFAVVLVDDLFYSQPHEESALQTLINHYEQFECSVIGTHEVNPESIHNYGVISGTQNDDEEATVLDGIIEKPIAERAPSNQAVLGRYVLDSKIFSCIEQTVVGKNGEIQLTDAIEKLIQSEKVHAIPIKIRHFDCGSKEGWYKANMFFGDKIYGFKL